MCVGWKSSPPTVTILTPDTGRKAPANNSLVLSTVAVAQLSITAWIALRLKSSLFIKAEADLVVANMVVKATILLPEVFNLLFLRRDLAALLRFLTRFHQCLRQVDVEKADAAE